MKYQVRPRGVPEEAQRLLAAQRAPVALRGRRRRRVVAVVLARAPVVAVATVRPVLTMLILAAAPGPSLTTVEGVALVVEGHESRQVEVRLDRVPDLRDGVVVLAVLRPHTEDVLVLPHTDDDAADLRGASRCPIGPESTKKPPSAFSDRDDASEWSEGASTHTGTDLDADVAELLADERHY